MEDDFPTPTNRVRYWYLGAGHLVGTVYNQPSVKSILFDSGDAYDAMDRFDRISISRWVKSTTDLYKVDLSYDRNSNPADVDDSVQTGFDWQYTYDDLDRLTRAQSGTLSGGSITSETRDQNFTLNHPGNWTHTDYDLNADNIYTGAGEFDWDFTFNKANEITQWDHQTDQVVPVYDAAGNMTDDKRDYQYVYDAFYRLVTVKNQSGTVKAEYKYNGLGYRISARYDQTAPWYHFAYDERWRIVAMYEDNDTAPTEQFWYQNAGANGVGGSSYIDETVLRDRDTTGNGTLDERLYYCQNWHHDIVALLDTSGSVSERANYNAYGEPIGTFTSVNNRKGYAGYEIDPNLNELYHVRHRVLNAKLGQWTIRAPLAAGDADNLYSALRLSLSVDTNTRQSQHTDPDQPESIKDCENWVHNRCFTDPIWGKRIREAWKAIHDKCGGRQPAIFCLGPKVCKHRCGSDTSAGCTRCTCHELPFLDTPRCWINICWPASDNPRHGGICGVLLHEMIHMRQYCERGIFDDCEKTHRELNTLEVCIDIEFEAWTENNDCGPEPPKDDPWAYNAWLFCVCDLACGSCLVRFPIDPIECRDRCLLPRLIPLPNNVPQRPEFVPDDEQIALGVSRHFPCARVPCTR